MAGKLVCWRCGEALGKIPRPFPRLASCKHCEADLHVCLMCQHYNPRYSTRCSHELAEPAREIDLANFCHYLKLKPDSFTEKLFDQSKQAEAKLKALFGENETTDQIQQEEKPKDPMAELKKLFDESEADKST